MLSKQKRMSLNEFNKAFKMIHSVYRFGKADENDDGVDEIRRATKDLIASNLPGRYSAKNTVAEIQFIHADHEQDCSVLKGSMVRKDDLKGLQWEARQEFIQELVKEGWLLEHSDEDHYFLDDDLPLESSHRALQFVSGTELNSKAEIFWFSKEFTWKSRNKKAIPIMDWIDDDDSMKKGITLKEFKRMELEEEIEQDLPIIDGSE